MDSIEKKLRSLQECFISHAEIEYLWDPQGNDTGFIDPNALSAGGFPFVFRTILDQIAVDDTHLSISAKSAVKEAIKAAFPSLAEKEILELLAVIINSLQQIGATEDRVVDEFCIKLRIKGPLLTSLYTKDYFSRLRILFASEYGIVWCYNQLWKRYKLLKVTKFKEIVVKRQGISFFPKEVVMRVYEYMEAFLSTLGRVASPTYTTYDVEWESDMSYYIAESLEKQGIAVTVLSDLHANTGLFSEIPLKALVAPYGNTQYRDIYSMLLNPVESSFSQSRVYFKGNSTTLIATPEKKHILINGKLGIDLRENVFLTHETASENFKQYAYLWEHFDKSQYNVANESHKKMYLSSLLNAKSAFFELLQQQEQQEGFLIARPKSIVFSRDTQPTSFDGFAQWVTIKEGSWCSTGGKHVHRKPCDELQSFLSNVDYQGIVVQNYVPSILFYQQGQPLHGHVRKASMIKRNGEVVHAGFIIKLIAIEKGNSSGYKSHMLYFDESGNFVFGKDIGDKSVHYTNLSQANLEPAVDFSRVFLHAKQEWLKAMYALNKFISTQRLDDFTTQLVKDGKISERYLINCK